MKTNATNDGGTLDIEHSRVSSFVIRHSSLTGAFTLIEIMVVVAIMGLILAAGIPSLYGMFHKEGLRKSMSDLLETCQSARAAAIMSGSPSELILHPREGLVEASGGGSAGYGAWAHTAKIEGAKIEALKINNGKQDYSQAEEVHVRFFPNGTCDEMILLLISDNNELRGISLEITTGIAVPLSDADIRALAR
jgi:type II secretion system protein H